MVEEAMKKPIKQLREDVRKAAMHFHFSNRNNWDKRLAKLHKVCEKLAMREKK
jgi:hypothetical protein